MGSFLSDARYAVRVILKNPGFSLVAIAALALGIGANAAIFSVVNAVLLQPLPYPQPDRLMRVCRQFPNGLGCSESIPRFMTARGTQLFEAIAAYDFAGPGLNLGGGDRPEQVKGIHVTADYFRVFAASTTIGRTFNADEDRPGGPHVAVLSYGLWVSRFGKDPAILGRSIGLNGEPYNVVGVISDRFRSTPPADLFIPLQPDPNSTNHGNYLSVAGRLKAGVSVEAARAEMRQLGDQFRRANPKWMGSDEHATVEPMRELLVRDVRPALLILLGAVGLVLLIACANVASLLLVRATARRREMAIRAAIGAGRAQIVRQLLVESVLLATVGAVVGVTVGVWGARALIAFSPGDLPRGDEFARASFLGSVLDWRVLLFALGASVFAGVLFGLAPALHLSRTDLSSTLKEGGGHGATGARVARTRSVLVIAEVAAALVLLVGATLLIRTFISLRQVNPGFETRNVITMQTSLAGEKYARTRQVDALVRQVTQRLDAIPGVQASAMAISVPPNDSIDLPFRIEGRPLSGDDRFHGDEQWRSVSPEYFRALQIPLGRGRVFTERDNWAASPVVIINAVMAKKYWPSADPIGQRLTIAKSLGPEFEDPTREIVGIVGDVRETGLDQPPPPVMYIPAAQVPDGMTRLGNAVLPMTWVVRASANPIALVGTMQKEFLAVDGLLAVAHVRTMNQIVAESLARQNFNMLLLTIFGAIALGLAAVGIYGLMSYSVAQATHEIGVRLALGAAPADIVSLIVGRGMRLAGAGVGLGLVAAFGAVRVLSRLLFGVRATDPATYGLVAAGLAAIAFAACYLPARRAMHVDPVVALRHE
jgi:predicted permease